MKYLNKHIVRVGMFAHHRSTGQTVWKITNPRDGHGINEVGILCVKECPITHEYKVGIETWCDVNNLYLAVEQFTSNKSAKHLLEEDYDG